MKTILIFGGTGFIGTSLCNHLKEKGFNPIIIGRNQPKENLEHFLQWDSLSLGKWVQKLNNAYAVVNLVGKSVDCIKTPENCDTILRSRVDSTKLIGHAFKEVFNPPKVWIQMSTAHIYGDSETVLCTEDSTTGYGLAPFVAKKWEEAFHSVKPKNCRGVVLRTSFVLGKNGSVFQRLKKLTQFGLGGKLGNGKQGMSWIHEADLNHLITTAIEDENYFGIYIASAPNPVSNKVFMKEMRKALKVPFGKPTPSFFAKIGATYLFKTDYELALYGRYVKSKRLEEQGFTFQYPTLSSVLNHLTKKF